MSTSSTKYRRMACQLREKFQHCENSAKICYILLACFALFRLFIGFHTNYYLRFHSDLDDQLLANYADLPNHFHGGQTISKLDDFARLVKPIGYSLFLDFVHLTGIQIAGIFALIWLGLSIFCALTVKKLLYCTHKGLKGRTINIYCAVVYLFILFFPFPFSDVGVVVYRDHFLIVLVMLMILIQLQVYLNLNRKFSRIALLNILLAVIMFWIYITKEGSEYILLFSIVASITLYVVKLIKYLRSTKIILREVIFPIIKISVSFIVIPFVIVSGANFYKAVNNHYFGVYEINTLKGGEFGRFLGLVNQLDNPEKTLTLWQPLSSFKTIADTLPNFESSEVYNAVLDDSNSHIIKISDATDDEQSWDNVVLGYSPDFGYWVLRDKLNNEYKWWTPECSEKCVQDKLKSINNEIENAYNTGKLTKDKSRIFFSPLVGGQTPDELKQTTSLALNAYLTNFFDIHATMSYNKNPQPCDIQHDRCLYNSLLLNSPTSFDDSSDRIHFDPKNFVKKSVSVISSFYSLIHLILPIMLLLALAILIFQIVRRNNALHNAIILLFLIGCSLVSFMNIFVVCLSFPGFDAISAGNYVTSSVGANLIQYLIGATVVLEFFVTLKPKRRRMLYCK